MMNELPSVLKDEVMNDIYSKIIKQHPLFVKNFSEQFINDLSLCIREYKIGPEIIIQKKFAVQDNLYFILKGKVNLYWDK